MESPYLGGKFGQLTGEGIRYALVGVGNVTLDVLLLNLAVYFSGVVHGPLLVLFASLSYLAALTNSYFWNGRWTFRVTLRWRKQFPAFVITNMVGLAINGTVIFLLASLDLSWLSHAKMLQINGAKAVAIGATALWNFCAYRWLVFRPVWRNTSGRKHSSTSTT